MNVPEISKTKTHNAYFPSPGQYKIQELDKLMLTLHKQYGKIAKVGGLIGHPDLLFIYDGDEIRKVFQREEVQPHRYCIVLHNYHHLPLSHPQTTTIEVYRLGFNLIVVYHLISHIIIISLIVSLLP